MLRRGGGGEVRPWRDKERRGSGTVGGTARGRWA
jgi:hypothetical protein